MSGGPAGHRHGLSIGTNADADDHQTAQTSKIRVRDLTVSMAGGDGVYIQNATNVSLLRVGAAANFRRPSLPFNVQTQVASVR